MNKFILAGTHLLAAGIGAGVAYFALKTHFEAVADEEILSVKEHYLAVHKDGPIVNQTINNMPEAVGNIPASVLQELKERMESGNYISDSETPPEHQEVLSIFDENPPDDLVVLNTLLAERNTDLPYVITFSEWQENADGFEQHTLTYWGQDNVLTDDDEQIIPDIQGTVGGALSYFGIGSDDPDIVYVRVESSQVDLEIVRDKGSYDETVNGNPSLDRIDRMRGDD